MTRTPPGRGIAAAFFALDAVLVVVFAGIGRASHQEGLDAAGVWATAWPFLLGLGAGWLLVRAWRRPAALIPTGIAAWLATVVIGMLARIATGEDAAAAFVIVATATLALLLLGWRALVALVRRIRASRGPALAG
ncbi:DUF3054 domain-containing protein [Agromyces sp. SYSU T0242]|uniref:DUF3054 domain-containing protein n=1 Tax=Agromyces litoreus TaxID=3158561 RepID=UPI003390911E